MDETKFVLLSKTFLFNALLVAVSLGYLKEVPMTDAQMTEFLKACFEVATGGNLLLRAITKQGIHFLPKTPADKNAVKALAFVALFPVLASLGACNTTGGTVGKLSTDQRLAQAEAVLAATNAAAQVAISNGLIKAADAPKVQAAIDGAAFAVAQAKQALADGKIDATDAISAAIAASATIPVIIAEYKSAKP